MTQAKKNILKRRSWLRVSRNFLGAFLVATILILPVSVTADTNIQVLPIESQDSQSTILGMTYPQAALVSAAIVGGALVINSLVGANLGTTLAALYVGHLIVEAGIVAIAAGGSLGLNWWADDTSDSAAFF